jgi:ribosome biogenesis GTPase A
MPSYWRHVNQVIREAEIIIEVLDARLIKETRNAELEGKVLTSGKRLLYVVNKCDLVDKKKLEAAKKTLRPSVFISSKDHLGTTILKKKILELSRGEAIIVGVVGYPNVGKSSLINALSGRGAARTSSESGFTKGMQKIKVDNKIMILDTPGVFPHKEKDVAKHSKTGSIDFGKIKDPEYAALRLIEDELKAIVGFYEITGTDPDEILEKIAFKLNKLAKGGKPNLEAAARQVLKDWQTGKIIL